MGIRIILRAIRRYIRAFKREYPIGKKQKPQIINLLANDICNSKCQMCFIWKQKKDFEFDPDQLSEILRDPLFSEVRHVGITGGEPTLRKDLAELYSACIENLPNLIGVSIITNAIQYKQVTTRISDIHALCQEADMPFSAMVSLDGLNEVHDTIRGRKGNFDSAIQTIHFLQDLMGEEKVAFGCTITKDNVWNMHTFLDYVQQKGYYGRFRIAEYINRLYNEGATEVIRTFDEDETYELTTFFMRLIEDFEPNPDYQRTYWSIIHMLNGGNRLIKCPYQSIGVVLDCRGNMQYCAPKSKSLGNALKQSALAIWNNNMQERGRIIKEECQDCIHDYHAPESLPELNSLVSDIIWRNILRVGFYFSYHKISTLILKNTFRKKRQKSVFITGWYGTETVGDKAILGSIISDVRKEYPEHEIIISTLTNEHVVNRTLKELNEKAKVVYAYSSGFVSASLNSTCTILGGGPLMDMGAMSIPLWAFKLARSRKNETIVWGCGLGPLKSDLYLDTTREILRHATKVMLRDSKSIQNCKALSEEIVPELSGDPAVHYVRNLKVNRDKNIEPHIACFLREWPIEYSESDDLSVFEQQRNQIEGNLAHFIRTRSKDTGLPVVLYPMHTLNIGGDDRIFARRFIDQHLSDIDARCHNRPTSVADIAHAMTQSQLNICMRFHSVLFASELETDFIAIDYTLGGKIYGYLKDRNQLDRYQNIEKFMSPEFTQPL